MASRARIRRARAMRLHGVNFLDGHLAKLNLGWRGVAEGGEE